MYIGCLIDRYIGGMTKAVVSTWTCPDRRHVSVKGGRTCLSLPQQTHRNSSSHSISRYIAVVTRLGRPGFCGRDALTGSLAPCDLAENALEVSSSQPPSSAVTVSIATSKTIVAVIVAMMLSLEDVRAEEIPPQSTSTQQQHRAETVPSGESTSLPESSTNPTTITPDDRKSSVLVDRIKWLNQVTSQVTEELNEVHPPPLRDIVDSVMSSEVSKDIQGISNVVGGAVDDLKDGFVGLNDTIRHINDEDNPLKKKIASSSSTAPGDTETVQKSPDTTATTPAKNPKPSITTSSSSSSSSSSTAVPSS